MAGKQRVRNEIKQNIMSNQNKSVPDNQNDKDVTKQLQTFSHTKILTDNAGVQIWSDPQVYKDQEFRNKALQTYSAQMASKSGYIKAADQMYDHLRSVTDTFIETHRNIYALDFGNERYKITFDMKPIYAQAFFPLEIGKNLKYDKVFLNIAPQETINRYLELYQAIKEGKVPEEVCNNYAKQSLKDNVCTIYYRMYEKDNEGGYYYDHITVPKKPSDNGALFVSIGSYEAISTSDAGLSFMYLFIRDFVLDEFKIDKAPGKIISTKVVTTGEGSRKELMEHDMQDYIIGFDVLPESKDTPIPKSKYVGQGNEGANADGFILEKEYYDTLMHYGQEYANTIKSVLSSEYVQMSILASIEEKDYDLVCQNSFVGTKLSSLRQLICQDLIQLSKLTLANRHHEHQDNYYDSRDDFVHTSGQITILNSDDMQYDTEDSFVKTDL